MPLPLPTFQNESFQVCEEVGSVDTLLPCALPLIPVSSFITIGKKIKKKAPYLTSM